MLFDLLLVFFLELELKFAEVALRSSGIMPRDSLFHVRYFTPKSRIQHLRREVIGMDRRDKLSFGVEYKNDRNAPGPKGLEGIERVVNGDFRRHRVFF